MPQYWRERMQSELGVTVPDDAQGCLQDVHWSSGYIGSFPTYTIGNVAAAGVMAHLHADRPEVTRTLATGEIGPLREVLRETIWSHGRSRSRAEILSGIGQTGTSPYLAHLANRFAG